MNRSSRGRALFLSLATLILLTPVARCDDVYLKSGGVFEGVIVTLQGDDRVHLQLQFGAISLASSLVDRIVLSESDLERFLARREQLIEASAAAGDWLELASWADARGLNHGYREAALRAAREDPFLDGLAPHMRSLGLILDREAALWVPYSPPAPPRAAASVDEPRPEAHQERWRRTEERIDRLAEAVVDARLDRLEEESGARSREVGTLLLPVTGLYSTAVWAGWSFPEVQSSAPPPPNDPNPEAPVTRRPSNPVAQALLRRQPGSLIPVSTLAR